MGRRIAYDYLFNYFGGDKLGDKVVSGASLILNIRAYKDGQEVLFEGKEEPLAHGHYMYEIFDVWFDRENQFIIKKNLKMDNLFRLMFGWDKIEAYVTDYELNVNVGTVGDMVEDMVEDMPEEFSGLPCCEPEAVTEEEFRDFIRTHADDFDINDNKPAQVISYCMYEPDKESGDKA